MTPPMETKESVSWTMMLSLDVYNGSEYKQTSETTENRTSKQRKTEYHRENMQRLL